MKDLKQEYSGRKVIVTTKKGKVNAVIHYCEWYNYFFFCGDDVRLNGENNEEATDRGTKYAWCVEKGTTKHIKDNSVTDWKFKDKIIEVW